MSNSQISIPQKPIHLSYFRTNWACMKVQSRKERAKTNFYEKRGMKIFAIEKWQQKWEG